jgi:isoleucyl-tRNA synthetase
MEVREQVLKTLETARQEKFIGAPLEAHVHITANGDVYPLLEHYVDDLPGLFIVSQVDLENHANEPMSIRVTRAGGPKCERCWKYTGDVGSDVRFPTICASCASIVGGSLGE